LEAGAMAENFIETDEELGEDCKRRFNFTLGRYSHNWEHAQQAWILSLALSELISSSQCWEVSLIAKTWLTSWDMLEQQNCTLSYVNLTMTEMMTFKANSRISLSGEKTFLKPIYQLHSQLLGTQAAHSVYKLTAQCNCDGCSLRMWNVRRKMAPEEWDLQRKIKSACGTG
jgi:hypothetical protein